MLYIIMCILYPANHYKEWKLILILKLEIRYSLSNWARNGGKAFGHLYHGSCNGSIFLPHMIKCLRARGLTDIIGKKSNKKQLLQPNSIFPSRNP